MKKLPLIFPIICSYQHHAVGNSIIAANAKQNAYMDWISNNYIQLRYRKDKHTEVSLDFFTPMTDLISPLLITLPMSRDYAKIWESDVTQFIMKNIDSNCYVYTPINTRYISHYKVSQRSHPILIYGYNQEAEIFFAADYFYNIYEFKEITFNEFFNAYNNYKDGSFWWEGLKILEFTDKGTYNVDKENIINLLEDYYYSRDTSIRYRMDRNYTEVELGFGISLYKRLLYDLSNLPNMEFVDIRPYAVLLEHKLILVKTLPYVFPNILETNYLERLSHLEELCLLLRNMVIKYQLTHNASICKKCVSILESIEDKDNHLFKALSDIIF